MKKEIRVGTRESELALWQANKVKELVLGLGYPVSLVPIKSEGDLDQNTPLYEMGVQGIFTRSLDNALLNNQVDIAVHSMKDVPTILPKGIVTGAILERGSWKDIFIPNENYVPGSDKIKEFPVDHLSSRDEFFNDIEDSIATIATGSIRRKAQWLHRYPKHTIVNLRGNVNTRLNKLHGSSWNGAVMAAAGLERLNLKPDSAIELDWMLPAPAQGAILIVCREDQPELRKVLDKLNHLKTQVAVEIEREFLRGLLGGCSTPISALATWDKKEIYFRGSILSLDGKAKVEIEKYIRPENAAGFGLSMAGEILKNGGKEISDSIKNA